MKKYEKGDLVKIRFYDHCVGMKEVMICEVVGWVWEDNKLNYILTHWVVDTDNQDIRDGNIEHTNILKSCIIKIRKLK